MAFKYSSKYVESDRTKNAYKNLQNNSKYKESNEVVQARNALNNLKAPGAYKSAYTNKLNTAMANIENMKPFSYDVNNDALYQQYKDQYINLGKMAMQDTMGQAAALTGGYGNSYASTAGNQAYQNYLGQLNDVIPQLYSLALDKYNMDKSDLYNLYNLYNDAENRDYGRYRDKVGDYQTNRNYLTDVYNNARNFDYSKFSDNRDYLNDLYKTIAQMDYQQWGDAQDRAWQEYQYQQAQAKAKSSGGSGRRSSGGSSGGGGNGDSGTVDMSKVQNFQSSLLNQTGFGIANSSGQQAQIRQHNMDKNDIAEARKYKSYADYYTAQVQKAYESGQLTEAEAEHLMKKMS